MNQYEARLDTLERRRQWVFLARVRGLIGLAEGSTDSAVAQFRRGDKRCGRAPDIQLFGLYAALHRSGVRPQSAA